MITKPKDAKPSEFMTDNFFTVQYFTPEQCAQIAKAYALSIIDAMQGAYGADRERDEWYDTFNGWEGNNGIPNSPKQ